MARVLVAFFAGNIMTENKLPCFYDAFVKALEKSGNAVRVYAHQCFGLEDWGGSESVPEDIRIDIENFDPEICIIFNNAFYDLTEICSCPIFVYFADTPIYYSNKNRIRSNPDRYFFNGFSKTKDVLINDFGMKENHFTEYIPATGIEREVKPYNTNICFIGTKFLSHEVTIINAFLQLDVSRSEIEEYERCLNIVVRNPYISVEEMVRMGFITSNSVRAAMDLDALRMLLSDEKRIRVLQCVVDLGLDLYGTENWSKDYFCSSQLNMAYHKEKVYTLEDNMNIYNTAKIGLNVSHIQAVDCFPWRILDIMASNACLVTDYHEDFEKYFKGLSFPIYNDEYEAREICKELLANDSKRMSIVEECNAYVKDNFDYSKAFEGIESITGVRLKE